MNKKFLVIKGDNFTEEFWNPLYQKVMSGKGNDDETKLIAKLLKTIELLSIDPFYNSLNSHSIQIISNRYKTTPITVFESYIENRNSRAGRIFWIYSPEKRGVIVIVGFSDHPENTKFGYTSLKFPDLKKYENKTKEREMKRKNEENRFGRKMMKESIDIDKEQIVEITPAMKQKYPSLKGFYEILVTGERMNWWDADMYTYDTAHQWFLPSREQLKDIWKIIDTDEFEWAWTGEVYVTNDGDCSYRAWKVSSNGDEATEKKMDDFFIFCLR